MLHTWLCVSKSPRCRLMAAITADVPDVALNLAEYDLSSALAFRKSLQAALTTSALFEWNLMAAKAASKPLAKSRVFLLSLFPNARLDRADSPLACTCGFSKCARRAATTDSTPPDLATWTSFWVLLHDTSAATAARPLLCTSSSSLWFSIACITTLIPSILAIFTWFVAESNAKFASAHRPLTCNWTFQASFLSAEITNSMPPQAAILFRFGALTAKLDNAAQAMHSTASLLS
mmetsp:Transcript_37752/g.58917  ORF Transcript_37752/g.58917 Transcript_37752/m.58917 type:complete len:234 (+) Transcript_37752:428-1129(+)